MGIWKIEDKQVFLEQILKMKEDKIIEIISNEKEKYYKNTIELPKKDGKRYICCIDKNSNLYQLQKNLCQNFLENIMISDLAYGFVKKLNYADYLYPHVNFYKKNYYLRLDIKNFFDSIDYEVLKSVLSYYFKESDKLSAEEKEKLIEYTLEILTYEKSIVQGAVTSPVISNIVFRSLDIRIARYCRRYGIKYTRYADDLLFSSESKRIYSDMFMSGITRILKSKCFYVNYKKIIRSKEEISLGGYVISDSIRLSRKKLSDINRVLFYLKNNSFENTEEYFYNMNSIFYKQGMKKYIKGKYELLNFLAGYRSFIISIVKYSDDSRIIDKNKKMIKRIEDAILEIDK